MPVKLPSTKWELMALEKHTHLPLESVFHRSMESLHICSFSDYLWHNQYKNEIFLFLKYLLNLGPLPQSCLAKRHLHNKRKVSSVEGTPCPWKCDMKHRACHSGYVKATWHFTYNASDLGHSTKKAQHQMQHEKSSCSCIVWTGCHLIYPCPASQQQNTCPCSHKDKLL